MKVARRLAKGKLLRIPLDTLSKIFFENYMARPTKQSADKRSAIIRVRATLAEKKQLEANAAEAGLTVSDWIRGKAIGAEPLLRKPHPDREVLLRYLAAYGRISSNLNQVSRQLNRKQDSEEFEIPIRIVAQALDEVREATAQIRNILKHGYKIEVQG